MCWFLLGEVAPDEAGGAEDHEGSDVDVPKIRKKCITGTIPEQKSYRCDISFHLNVFLVRYILHTGNVFTPFP